MQSENCGASIQGGPSPKSPGQRAKEFVIGRTIRKPVKRAALATAAILLSGISVEKSTNIWHNQQAHHYEATHLGLGIYYNHKAFLHALPPELSRRIQEGFHPSEAIQIANEVSRALEGIGQEKRTSSLGLELGPNQKRLFPESVWAEEMLDGDPKSFKGVCRHRALVLHHFLKTIGIPNQIVTAKFSDTSAEHAWVILNEGQICLDPMNPSFSGEQLTDYLKSWADGDQPIKSGPHPINGFPRSIFGTFGESTLVD